MSSQLGEISFEELVAEIITRLGDDPEREGLTRTPERVKKSLEFLTNGYRTDIENVINGALFEETHKNMVLVKQIEVYSLCEHHLLPFFGKVHIGYVPSGKIVGLSKMARIVEVYARRLQVQERLTEQIAQAVWDLIEPVGVGVVIEAQHLCMMMRGVQKQNSKTVTSGMRGTYLDDSMTRTEFLRLCGTDYSSVSS